MTGSVPGQVDRGAGLALVRVVRVAGAQVAERHRHRAVLHLPDVAELVDDEVVGGSGSRTRIVQWSAYPSKRRSHGSRKNHGAVSIRTRRMSTERGYQIEPVEPRFRADDLRLGHCAVIAAVSTRIAVPSPGSVW